MSGVDYVKSHAFGALVLEEAESLTREQGTDFTEAVARTFMWFDKRVARESDFIAARFPTRANLKAYVRKALVNENRRTLRSARREIPSAEFLSQIGAVRARADEFELESVRVAYSRLAAIEQEVIDLIVAKGLTASDAARHLGLHRKKVSRTYLKAIDKLRQMVEG